MSRFQRDFAIGLDGEPREVFKFSNADQARRVAKKLDKVIYCELFGIVGVLQVYPGGRSVLYPAIPRYQSRLTSDEVLRQVFERLEEPPEDQDAG